jgi:hypothetical protein
MNFRRKGSILRTDDFVKEYAKTISLLGNKISSLPWWSVLISSKDRFLCPLQDLFISLERNSSFNFNSKIKYSSILKLFLAPLLFGYRVLFVKTFFYSNYQKSLKALQFNKTTLLRSFSYEASFHENGSYRDPFWGDLIDRLDERNMSYIRVTEPIMPWNKVRKNFSNAENLYISYYFLSFLDCFRALLLVLKGLFVKFPSEIYFKEINVKKQVLKQYKKDLLSISSYTAMLNYLVYKNIAKKFELKQFLLPYEGLPWERMAILGAREFQPDIFITGYQHAVVSPAALNYFNYYGDISPKPNIVLTLGEITKGIIEKFNLDETLSYQVSGALRYRKRSLEKKAIKLDNRNEKVLLIALEGTIVTERFLNYILQEMCEIEDWKVIIRTHPMLAYKKLKPYINKDILKKVSFEVSKNKSLEEDLLQASVVAYWGSTVSLEALELGLPIMGFTDKESVLNYDPNYLFKDFKWEVKEKGDVLNSLRSIENLDSDEYSHKSSLAFDYVQKYFYPVNDQILDDFLRNE